MHRPNFDGDHSRTWWQTRDSEAASSAALNWELRTHPSRDALAKAVAGLPASSVLEIGCHAGQTLWALAQRKTFDRMAGTELSSVVLDFARAHLPQAVGGPVELVQGAADKLPFGDKSFDVIITSSVLVCIGPKEIMPSLAEMIRVCRGYLVLGESFSDNPREATAKGRKERFPNTSYWVRNYAGLLKGRAELVKVEHLPPQMHNGHLNSILIFKVTAAAN